MKILIAFATFAFMALNLAPAHAAIGIEQAENIISEFTYTYKNDILRDGKKYVVDKRWNENAFDASIKSNLDNTVVLKVTKGVLVNKHMTEDTFRIILCHEFGHYFGGAPKKEPGHWASSEGQSDYYATSKCIKRIIPKKENLIERAKNGALNFGRILAEMNNEDPTKISLDNHDTSEVFSSDSTHPHAQCRLDTLIAGLNCPISERVEFSSTNPNTGACLETSVNDLIANSARPRCWYRPRVVGKLCQSKLLIPGQKMPMSNFYIKKYRDDGSAELSGLIGIANPKFRIVEKAKRFNDDTRFETLNGKIQIDGDQMFIDQELFKSYAQKSLLPIKLEQLNLKAQGSSYVFEVLCKEL